VRLPYSRLGHARREIHSQADGKSDWEEAKALVATWEAANSWDGKVPPPMAEPTPLAFPARITIADATKVFLSNR